jgi:hypothetical protein
MGEHKRKALALAAPSGARPAPLTPEFVLSGDRVGQDGRLYTRDGQTVGLGPTHGAVSPFSRCVVISEAPMVWFYGELPARWLGARGVQPRCRVRPRAVRQRRPAAGHAPPRDLVL